MQQLTQLLKAQRHLAPRHQRATGMSVMYSFGVTVLSDMVYRPWSLEGKQIEARPIAEGVPDMELGLLWQPGRKLDKPADALREFLIHASGS